MMFSMTIELKVINKMMAIGFILNDYLNFRNNNYQINVDLDKLVYVLDDVD